MKTESKKLENGDLQITLTFDAHDQLCLNHDLLSIEDWYSKGPSSEKIHNCKSRMMQENKEKLFACKSHENKTMAEMKALMDDHVACCEAISKLDGYKNRKQRDEESSKV